MLASSLINVITGIDTNSPTITGLLVEGIFDLTDTIRNLSFYFKLTISTWEIDC